MTTIASCLNAIAAIFLVVVTWRYTRHTQSMVEEMRAARFVQLLPKIVPQVKWDDLGARLQYIQIINIGPGAAFHVDVVLSYQPGGLEFGWQGWLLAAGATVPFSPSQALKRQGFTFPFKDAVDLDDLGKRYKSVRLVGSCRDAMGGMHQIDEGVPMNTGWVLKSPLGSEDPSHSS